MPDQTISAESVRTLFHYDAQRGVLVWRVARGKVRPGTEVTSRSESCVQVMIDGRNYKAHRVIWTWVHGAWPDQEIDHSDGDPFNNRIGNLRLATSSQNKMNRPGKKARKGAYLDKRDGRWSARIVAGGRVHHLGRFDTEAEAAEAYRRAAPQVHGEFACPTR